MCWTVAGSSCSSAKVPVEDSLKPASDMAARTGDWVQMIALWTLKERVWVVMVRSEYFSEFRRLVLTSRRLLLAGEAMVDLGAGRVSILIEVVSEVLRG